MNPFISIRNRSGGRFLLILSLKLVLVAIIALGPLAGAAQAQRVSPETSGSGAAHLENVSTTSATTVLPLEGEGESEVLVPAVFFMSSSQALLASPQSAPRPVGTVTKASGPTVCGDSICYELIVKGCAEVWRNARVLIKIGEPTTGSPALGSIVFFSGQTGNSYWEGWSPEAARVLTELRGSGYRTVQIKWKTVWQYGAPGAVEGLMKLGCRPATVLTWAYNTLHAQDTATPFCAYGHSNGASQLAYSLTNYSLANVIDAAVFESGPNWARNDIGCLHNDPANANLNVNLAGRKAIDKSFGFASNGTGPCALQDVTRETLFAESGVVNPTGQHVYTTTMAAFIFGELDTGTTANHGKYFYNTLVQAGSPLLSYATVPGAGHSTFATTQGADLVRDTLIAECRIH